MDLSNYIPHEAFSNFESKEGIMQSRLFYETMKARRSIRGFTNQPVDKEIIYNAIRSAGCAPSGANAQPWFFCAIFDPEIKRQIRIAAEKVESGFYERSAGENWLSDLEHLGTDALKPHLEDAACLIPVFSRSKIIESDSNTETRAYYQLESTCLATGILLTSLHKSGLGTLTHTPKPMRFLNEILGLDKTYKPVMIVVAGYPEKPVLVPNISRRPLGEICKTY